MAYGDGFLPKSGSTTTIGGGGGDGLTESEVLALIASNAIVETDFIEIGTQAALDAIATANQDTLVKITAAFGDYKIGDLVFYDSEDSTWEIVRRDQIEFLNPGDAFPDLSDSDVDAEYKNKFIVRGRNAYLRFLNHEARVAATGTWNNYVDSSNDFEGALDSTPDAILEQSSNVGKYVYIYTEHLWKELQAHVIGSITFYTWTHVSLQDLISNGIFLGNHPDEASAANSINGFNNTIRYLAYFDNDVQELVTSTYVVGQDSVDRPEWTRIGAAIDANGNPIENRAMVIGSGGVTHTSDDIALTPTDSIGEYRHGLRIAFVTEDSNAGNVTVNVDGLGEKSLRKSDNSEFAADELPDDTLIRIIYIDTEDHFRSDVDPGGTATDGRDGVPGLGSHVEAQLDQIGTHQSGRVRLTNPNNANSQTIRFDNTNSVFSADFLENLEIGLYVFLKGLSSDAVRSGVIDSVTVIDADNEQVDIVFTPDINQGTFTNAEQVILGFQEDDDSGADTSTESAGGATPARETTIYESDAVTFVGGTPQNFTLDIGLDTFESPGFIHFRLIQDYTAGSTDNNLRGLRAEAEFSLDLIRNLPIVTDTLFSTTGYVNVALERLVRLGNIDTPGDVQSSSIAIGRKSNTELRISVSNPLLDDATLEITVVELKGTTAGILIREEDETEPEDTEDDLIYVKVNSDDQIEKIRIPSDADDNFFGITPTFLENGAFGYAATQVGTEVLSGGSSDQANINYFWEEKVNAGRWKWVVGLDDTDASDYIDSNYLYLQFNDKEQALLLLKNTSLAVSGTTFYVGYQNRSKPRFGQGELNDSSINSVSLASANANAGALAYIPPEDELWITDITDNAIYRKETDGSDISGIHTLDGDNGNPTAMCYVEPVDEVWIADGSSPYHVHRYETNGTYIGSYAPHAGISSPTAMVYVESVGQVWIIDSTDDLIYRMETDGTLITATYALLTGNDFPFAMLYIGGSVDEVWVGDSTDDQFYRMKPKDGTSAGDPYEHDTTNAQGATFVESINEVMTIDQGTDELLLYELEDGPKAFYAVCDSDGNQLYTSEDQKKIYVPMALGGGFGYPKEITFAHRNMDVWGLVTSPAIMYPNDTANVADSRRNLWQRRKFITGQILDSSNKGKPIQELVNKTGVRGDVDVHNGESATDDLIDGTIWTPKAGRWEVNAQVLCEIGEILAGMDIALLQIQTGTDRALIVDAETGGQTQKSIYFANDQKTIHGKLSSRTFVTDGETDYCLIFGLSVIEDRVLTVDGDALTAWRAVNLFLTWKLFEEY